VAAAHAARHDDRVSVPVLVVVDQRPFRLAAAAVLRRTPGFALVGEAATGEEAVARALELRPALVLMDIRLPGTDGVEAAQRIAALLPGTVTVLCSTYAPADLPHDLATSGAVAYVHKEELRPDLLQRLWEDYAPVA
jgi:DNA-binding NarL/FixJ family response regulator